MIKSPIFLFGMLLFFPIEVYSTMYYPVAIEQQMRQADAIVESVYVDKFARELGDGQLVTELFFRVEKGLGLSEADDSAELSVFIPGGELGDRHIKVHGTPEFSTEEQSILFLKRDPKTKQLWLLNLAMGKYKIEKIGNSRIFVSAVYPLHPRIGQISEVDFIARLKRVKGEFFSKYHAKSEKRVNRSIAMDDRLVGTATAPLKPVGSADRLNRNLASLGREDESEDKISGMSLFWLVLILSLLGGLRIVTRRTESE